MTPEQRRHFNTVFGGVLLSLGIIAWLLAGYFSIAPRAPAPPLLNAKSVDLSSCRSALSELGYRATERPNEVLAFEALDPPRAQAQLEKASIAVNLCHLSLHTFCVGDGCEQPGITLVLRKPVEAAVTAVSTEPKISAVAAKALPSAPGTK